MSKIYVVMNDFGNDIDVTVFSKRDDAVRQCKDIVKEYYPENNNGMLKEIDNLSKQGDFFYIYDEDEPCCVQLNEKEVL